ncbi:MAG: transposase [Acidobacteria bacterium]|nr:transposase [Acidobacteriota bacterium]
MKSTRHTVYHIAYHLVWVTKYRRTILNHQMQEALKEILTITIKREAGKWRVNFTCEVEADPLPTLSTAIGVDVNLENFLTTSDGEVIDNPRWYRKAKEYVT